MTTKLPIYWHKDRNRWRVHLPDGRKVTLKRDDGTPFPHCARWHPDLIAKARSILEATPPQKKGLGPFAPGTFHVAARNYLRSARFAALKPITQQQRRYQVESFAAEHGEKRVTTLQPRHVRAMMDDLAGKPGAQRERLTVIRELIFGAVEDRQMSDPTVGIARPALSKHGFRDWPEDLIAQFEAHHPVGSEARLALGLGLGTAQRRADVVRMGRQHVRGGKIAVTQQKTGTPLWLPIRPELQQLLDLVPPDRLAFLVTHTGAPYTAKGFAKKFARWCREAAIPPGYSFHGLRKAACRRLAEAGCSASEIMAISGHKSLGECERYVREASQVRLAEQAISRTSLFPNAEQAFPKGKKA